MADPTHGTVSKKELVLAGHMCPRDAAKDTECPDQGVLNVPAGRSQGTLTCECAAVPPPRVGRGSKVGFPHPKGKLRHSAAQLLLSERPSQAALQNSQHHPRAG